MKKRWLISYTILVLFTLSSFIGSQAQAISILEKGSVAPDFQLTTIDGKVTSLSDFRGQTVILNFWASWCPPCREEMPELEQFYKKNKQNNVTILSVNLTSQDSGRQKLQQFIQDYSLTFPILLDQKGEVGKLYQILTIPTSFIISSTGNITDIFVGPLTTTQMTDMIKKAQ